VARRRSGLPTRALLNALGVSPATWYRWQKRKDEGRLADAVAPPRRSTVPPTPAEVEAVRRHALKHPLTGYKRLAWSMVDADLVALRPHQVHQILVDADLLCWRGAPPAVALRRPAPAQRPDEQWHIDLMYVEIQSNWFYLVDIIDAYSRYLVHWTLNPTMTGDTIILTVQQALDGLLHRRPDEPKVVHDSGSQFVSRDWRSFVDNVGIRDIRTRVAHPQSNGVVERVHRTHRQEALLGEATVDYHAAHGAFTRHVAFYNHQRPHTALRYLPPAVYYRGDPEAKLRERQLRLATAREARKAFWVDRSTHPHGSDPYHK